MSCNAAVLNQTPDILPRPRGRDRDASCVALYDSQIGHVRMATACSIGAVFALTTYMRYEGKYTIRCPERRHEFYCHASVFAGGAPPRRIGRRVSPLAPEPFRTARKSAMSRTRSRHPHRLDDQHLARRARATVLRGIASRIGAHRRTCWLICQATFNLASAIELVALDANCGE
jgi:hypothetical protein